MTRGFVRYLMISSCILIALGYTTHIDAQNCSGFQNKCEAAPKHFNKTSLSRSLSVRKGRKLIFNQTFFADREYFVSVCGKKQLGDIHLRLITDNEEQQIIFDNASTNFKNSQLFVIQNTMKIKIELSAPHYFDNVHSQCAGIQIYYHQKNKE